MVLGLFFTRGVSIDTWIKYGMFDREQAIYSRYIKTRRFKSIYWFTYGVNDLEILKKLKKEKRVNEYVRVWEMPSLFNSKIGKLFYSFLLPFIYRKEIKQCAIIKTNQLDGSWTALIAKWLAGIPLLFRTGYTKTLFLGSKKNKITKSFFTIVERALYWFSDHATVTSKADKNYLVNKYKINEKKISVIPNYVDTDVFTPRYDNEDESLLYIGRLEEQKNIKSMIEASSLLNMDLYIYGIGSLLSLIEEYAVKSKYIHYKGKVSNHLIPRIINCHKYFILVSFYEGMPKSLLEAMACERICIGSNVRGINEIITDGFNGYLSEDTDPESIIATIKKALNTEETIRKNARDTVLKTYSLDSYLEKESKIIFSLV